MQSHSDGVAAGRALVISSHREVRDGFEVSAVVCPAVARYLLLHVWSRVGHCCVTGLPMISAYENDADRTTIGGLFFISIEAYLNKARNFRPGRGSVWEEEERPVCRPFDKI
jgi:hypothetical protein